MKKSNKKSGKFWRYLTNFWTIVLFAVIIKDFITNGGYTEILGPVAALYTISLTIYSAEKEFERWHFYSKGKHPGEIYVIAWTTLVVGIFLAKLLTHSQYKMSPEIVATYIVVLGVLAITKKSKSDFIEKCGPIED